MPKHPIYVDLLPEAAKEVIGKTHKDGAGAKRYLEAEGFRYDGVIDIFDAGPCLNAPLSDLRTIRDSRRLELIQRQPNKDGSLLALISNDNLKAFRCILTQISFEGNRVEIDKQGLQLLGLASGDSARVWIKR